MASFTDLRTPADADAMLAASQNAPVWLFKHSATCPVSARAHHEVGRLGDDAPPVYRLVVQTARAASDALADALDVRHESPQAVLVSLGQAVAVLNHFSIRADALRAAAAHPTP